MRNIWIYLCAAIALLGCYEILVITSHDGSFNTAIVAEGDEGGVPSGLQYLMVFGEDGYVEELAESCEPKPWNLCPIINEEAWPVTIRSLALRSTSLNTFFGLVNAEETITPMRPIAHEVQCQFLGDSIFGFMRLHPSVWDPFVAQNCFNAAFAAELSENLLKRMEDRAPFATPGHKTQGFVDENLPPDTVFLISIGTNNIIASVTYIEWPAWMTEAEIAIETALQVAMGQVAAVARIRGLRPHARVAVLELLPQNRETPVDLMIVEANRMLSNWADKVPGVEVLKVHDAFTLPDGSFNPALFVDKAHPNEAGYAIIAEAVQAFLDSP